MRMIKQVLALLRLIQPSVDGTDADDMPAGTAALDPDVTETASDIGDGKVVFPLADLWSATRRRSGILVSRSATRRFVDAFGNLSRHDEVWARGTCNPRPYVAGLTDVTIVPGSRLVIDASGNALEDELAYAHREFSLRPKIWKWELLDGPRLSLPPLRMSPEAIPAGVHLTCEHEANYFHWIAEILPRLFLYDGLAREKELPLLVTEGLHPNLYYLLALVGAEGRPVRFLKKDLAYRVDRLVYPSAVSRVLDVYDRAPSHDTTFIPVGLLRAMVEHIKARVPAFVPAGPKRMFLKRRSGFRKLVNEEQVESCLKDHGFGVVDAGELSIREQVSMLANADVIVAPSGAACANLVWCSAGARAVILHSDHL